MTTLSSSLSRAAAAAFLVALAAAPLHAQQPLPIKYSGPATTAAITAGDLMTRLYIYADDSMMGRRVGTEDNIRATAYIEREVRRLGLVPAGDKGSYFQYLSTFARVMDPASSGTAAGMKLVPGTDFTGSQIGARSGAVVFGGMRGDTLAPDMIKGKVVVVTTPLATGGGRGGFAGGRGGAGGAAPAIYAGAAALVSVGPDLLPTVAPRPQVTETPETMVGAPVAADQPLQFTITPRVAAALFGQPVAQVAKGTQGGVLGVDIKYLAAPAPSRNVVAILPGTDPKLKNEYVLIGAHNDHIGFNNRPADHDSLKAFAEVFLIQGADSRPSPESLSDQAKWAQVNGKIAAARRLRPARPDSISNGADDDGSGSVTVLEVAEAFAKGAVKPKRSIIFIWQTGEESGMWGSGWFVDHPTVPRESIVAAVNMDMVGRGFASDVTGSTKAGGLIYGGPGYLQLVGSRRLSKEYGDLVESVNTEKKLGFTFDYEIDADGHPQNIYCRSDHWSYARYGIPVVFFTTGGHSDYHQVTDEPQYINYPHMADVAKLSFEVMLRAANLDHRVKVDAPGPFDGKARCRQ